VRYYHVPLVDELKRPQPAPADSPEAAKPVDYSRGYYRVALRAGDRIATILTRLADNQHCPAVLHCTSGRDRTGIVAAVLLGTLGILDEDIVSDYTQSSLYLQNAPELRRNTAATAGVPASSTDHGQQANSRPLTPEEIAPPDRMWSLLNTARKEHGSMEAFALALGVRADTIKLLKESLLE
jgi:protein-tyrosine phosphatase